MRVHRFLQWQIARADGKVHAGITAILDLTKALTHPVHGYLTQKPSLNKTLPEKYQQVNWEEACKAVFDWAVESKKKLVAVGVEHSRNPMEPIKPILELENPLTAIADMVDRMRASRPITGGVEEAIWARDLLLVRLMASNPLRAKNLKLLTYRPDNSGNLYRDQNGGWNIRIDKKAFKNAKGAAGDDAYDVGVNSALWSDIERYLQVYRPMLPDADRVDYVFLSSSTEKAKGYTGAWNSLERRFFYLTKRYLWGCPGIGSHGMRYIVATAILKKHPGAWEMAAAALHDKVDTVKQHYAHLRPRDKLARLYVSLSEAYGRL